MIFADPFYQTHNGEVFQQSNCMLHEKAVADLFTSILINSNYVRTSSDDRCWQRDSKKVIVCLADDFGVCRYNWGVPAAQWFDHDTMVITDNYMPHTTPYQVYQLPTSYFGIFNYIPADQNFAPSRRFNFSVNRLDDQRILILVELIKQSGGLQAILSHDYINFNARDNSIVNVETSTSEQIRDNFQQRWSRMIPLHAYLQESTYHSCFEQALSQVPIKNHQLSIEQTMVGAYINVVVETYAGDASVAFSEKIFRALVTPAPWTVFSARHAVRYLQTLGFDTLDDIIDHSYDSLLQDHDGGRAKISKFIESNLQNYQTLKTMDILVLRSRCQTAATHNQQLLADLQSRWLVDFAKWLPVVVEKIQ
jgi:hypothetical protein